MNRKPRNNCSICHAEGVNSRTCTGEFESHQALVLPKVERPPTRFIQYTIDWDEFDEDVMWDDIKLKPFDDTPVDTPTEQAEPSPVHEWPLTRLERLEAKLDTILAHLGL